MIEIYKTDAVKQQAFKSDGKIVLCSRSSGGICCSVAVCIFCQLTVCEVREIHREKMPTTSQQCALGASSAAEETCRPPL